jgi:hypothetical protein
VIIERSGRLGVVPRRPKMAPRLAAQVQDSLAALMFEWPRTVSRLRVLRFLSRYGAVGADVMRLSPEACEDR